MIKPQKYTKQTTFKKEHFSFLSPSQRILVLEYVHWLDSMVVAKRLNISTIRSIKENLEGFAFNVLPPEASMPLKNAIEDLDYALQLGPQNPHAFSWVSNTAYLLNELVNAE